MKLLHLYSPYAQHCDGFIVGTPEGLKALRDAIDRALKQQYAMTEAVCNDGEQYNIMVVGVVTDAIENRLVLPYTASYAKTPRVDVVHPHETLTNEMYHKLLKKQQEEDHV